MDHAVETGSSAMAARSPRRWAWLGVVVPLLLLGAFYADGIAYMVAVWSRDENYGHGFFIPLISAYLVWTRRRQLALAPGSGSWWGAVIVLIGLGLGFVGEFATLYVALHLSLWIVLAGLLVAAIGWGGVRVIAFPLLYLLVMIPLPDFLSQGLSGRLQLLSSQFGVGFLQWVGVTALREGNVIDLGTTQLQVVEACSGLRYLFPLGALALLCAYLFRERMWKRVAVFLISIPIAVGLNIFRIGVTGVLVDLYGVEVAEGFFHGFSGWLLFVTGLALLLATMWVLGRIGAKGSPRSFGALFDPVPEASNVPGDHAAGSPSLRYSGAYLLSLALLVLALVASTQIAARAETPSPRSLFAEFPMAVGSWQGRSVTMEPGYLDALRFDDYLLADFRPPDDGPVNLYVAYYRSQKKGQSAHSPRTCMPGGGWEITSIEQRDVIGAGGAEPLAVNQVVIQKGRSTQVVWYWFQERGRIVTNEYLVKFYLFWDAVVSNRTDGALIRLTAPVLAGEGDADAEARLDRFVQEVRPVLTPYLPN